MVCASRNQKFLEMSGRPRRRLARKNYKKVHEGIADSDEELQINAVDDLGVSEMEDSSEEEDSDSEKEEEMREWEDEDEEHWLMLSDVEFNEEFVKAKEKGDFLKLEFLLQVKEKRCAQLKEKIREEHERENKLKRKKMREIERRFKKLKQEESELTKSLVESRTSTPAGSPSTSPEASVRSTKKPPKTVEKKKKVVSTKAKPPSPASKVPGQAAGRKGERVLNVLPSKKSDQFEQLLDQALAIENGRGANTPYMPEFNKTWEQLRNERLDSAQGAQPAPEKFKIPAASENNGQCNGETLTNNSNTSHAIMNSAANNSTKEQTMLDLAQLLKQLELIKVGQDRCECKKGEGSANGDQEKI